MQCTCWLFTFVESCVLTSNSVKLIVELLQHYLWQLRNNPSNESKMNTLFPIHQTEVIERHWNRHDRVLPSQSFWLICQFFRGIYTCICYFEIIFIHNSVHTGKHISRWVKLAGDIQQYMLLKCVKRCIYKKDVRSYDSN